MQGLEADGTTSSWTMDANGNVNQLVLSQKQKDGQTESQCAYQYDARGNLVYEEDAEQGIRTDMEYDIRNQRVQKKENGKVTNYYYQDSAVYATADENDTIVNLHLLKGENNVAASVKCQGETQVGGTELFSEFCYTGSVYDSQTGKYYLNARYYEPENRRFLSQDSYRGEAKNPSSLHLYAYCAGDPVNFADVDGHKPSYITERGADVLVDGTPMKQMRADIKWRSGMFNIRKKLLQGVVCLCMPVMVCACQNLPHGERPYDYPPAKWVSESGDLWFEVTENTMARDENWHPILDGGAVIDGKTYECKVEFDSYVSVIFWDKNVWVQYMRDLEWENEWHPIPHPPMLVAGTCRFSPNKVKVSVNEVGEYFQHEKIIFIRQPSDKEEMTEKNGGKGWWWMIGANDLQ